MAWFSREDFSGFNTVFVGVSKLLNVVPPSVKQYGLQEQGANEGFQNYLDSDRDTLATLDLD